MNIKQALNILKVAASKTDYPLYASYLNSKDGKVSCTNDDAFILLKEDFGFNGIVNVFVLDDLLKKFDGDVKAKEEDGFITFYSGSLSSNINTLKYKDFPYKDMPDIQMIKMTPEVLSVIKTAMRFTGGIDSDYVYINESGIFGYNGQSCYYKTLRQGFDVEIAIDREVMKVLSNTIGIGGIDNKCVVEFENGYGLFQFPYISFPINRVYSGIESMRSGKDFPVCSSEMIKEGIDKVSPILYNEHEKISRIFCEDGEIRVEATSMANGKATYQVDGQCDFNFDVLVDVGHFKHIPDGFKFCVSGSNIYLFSEEERTEICIAGRL